MWWLITSKNERSFRLLRFYFLLVVCCAKWKNLQGTNQIFSFVFVQLFVSEMVFVLVSVAEVYWHMQIHNQTLAVLLRNHQKREFWCLEQDGPAPVFSRIWMLQNMTFRLFRLKIISHLLLYCLVLHVDQLKHEALLNRFGTSWRR